MEEESKPVGNHGIAYIVSGRRRCASISGPELRVLATCLKSIPRRCIKPVSIQSSVPWSGIRLHASPIIVPEASSKVSEAIALLVCPSAERVPDDRRHLLQALRPHQCSFLWVPLLTSSSGGAILLCRSLRRRCLDSKGVSLHRTTVLMSASLEGPLMASIISASKLDRSLHSLEYFASLSALCWQNVNGREQLSCRLDTIYINTLICAHSL